MANSLVVVWLISAAGPAVVDIIRAQLWFASFAVAALASCQLASDKGDEHCLTCENEGTTCAAGELHTGTVCTVTMALPPVPWDLAAAICAVHPRCAGLALETEPAATLERRKLGLQDVQPNALNIVVAKEKADYVVCAERVSGDGVIFVPRGPVVAAPRIKLEATRGTSDAPAEIVLKGLPWLDCSGPQFDPVWDEFHEMLLAEGVRSLLHEPLPAIIANSSAVLLSLLPFDHHVFKKSELFTAVLAGREAPEALGSVCFGGLLTVQVAYLLARHRNTEGTGVLMDEDTLSELVFIRISLGTRLTTDFLTCCSRWTFVTGMDLNEIIEQERKDRPVVGSAAAAADGAAEARAFFAAEAPLHVGSWPPLRHTSVRICVFGLFHFATLEDAVTLLQAALSGVEHVSIRVVHTKQGINEHYFKSMSGAGVVDNYVHEWCEFLDCTASVAPWIQLFRVLDGRYERKEAPILSPELFDLAAYTAAVVEAEGRYDFVVSANMDLVYVSLLSRAFPDARLLYFATDTVLAHDTKDEMMYLRLLSEELFFRKFSRGRLFASCEKLQVQTFYQLGAWPLLALTSVMGRRGGLSNAREDGDVLVFGRPALENSPVRHLLEVFLEANRHLDLRFTFAGDTLPWSVWGSFRACVYLPWNLHAVSFIELISLNIPLLAPVSHLAYTLTKVFNTGHRQDSQQFYTNDVGLWRDADLPSPFWSGFGPVRRQFLFWYELSHMRMRPGILYFSSFYELFGLLSDRTVLARARIDMRQAHLAAVVESVRTVAAAVAELLEGAP